MNFFLEALVHQRESAQQASPTLCRTLRAGRVIGIPADNYYNPFGVDVPTVARRFVEAGNRVVSEDVDLWRALIGFEGAVARWRWELALGNATSEATSVEKGFFSLSRLVARSRVHPGRMIPAASCAARPIPQPAACLRRASLRAVCRSIFSAGPAASRRRSWTT